MLWARNSNCEWFLAAFFVFGILLAGSDAEWFPVPNLVGVTSIGLCTLSGKQKVEDVKAGEMSWEMRKLCLGKPIHYPMRPEPKIAFFWETCQVPHGLVTRIMCSGHLRGRDSASGPLRW